MHIALYFVVIAFDIFLLGLGLNGGSLILPFFDSIYEAWSIIGGSVMVAFLVGGERVRVF